MFPSVNLLDEHGAICWAICSQELETQRLWAERDNGKKNKAKSWV
jgi:hypothetical protein